MKALHKAEGFPAGLLPSLPSCSKSLTPISLSALMFLGVLHPCDTALK